MRLPYGQRSAGRPRNAALRRALFISGRDLPVEAGDCFVPNIWTPAVAPVAGSGRKLSAIFWCHGGGRATGSGSSPDNDGTGMRGAATWSS